MQRVLALGGGQRGEQGTALGPAQRVAGPEDGAFEAAVVAGEVFMDVACAGTAGDMESGGKPQQLPPLKWVGSG